MPSRISIELSPSSAIDSMTALATPASVVPSSVKKSNNLPTISTSPPGYAAMDNATMGRPTTSPTSSSSSASFSSSTSPSSSTLSLPSSAVGSAKDKGKGKARAYDDRESTMDRDQVAFSTGPRTNHNAKEACTTQSSDTLLPMNNIDPCHHNDNDYSATQPIALAIRGRSATHNGATSVPVYSKAPAAGSEASTSPSRSDLYTHSNARSSNSSSLTSLSSVDEDDEYPKSNGKGKASGSSTSYGGGMASGSGSSHPRVASATAQFPYSSHVGSSSGSGSCSGSGSGSSSKPMLSRAATGPATLQRPFLTSTASSSAIPPVPALPSPMPQEKELAEHDFLGYDAIPDDFDFGDLPFYDTDPRTGTIYGDPHAITRPHLVPESYFDLYRLTHDEADPRRTNIFNKYGALLLYHPGRHIGQEQDSVRSGATNQPIWTMAGRTSTWGSLTATEVVTKRLIKIVMEHNRKKAAETSEPLARFVFRWKEDDFVTEYRKQKDQYRITCFQMCGGESKWRPPQPKPVQAIFSGADAPGNMYVPASVGTPSPFDSTRYLQLISEYRLNSGPVSKRGDFELYNPDTFPAEFKSFLMLTSLVILEVMRPVDDKLFYKEFPDASPKKSKVAGTGGLRIGISAGGRPADMAVVGSVGSASASSLAMNRSRAMTSSASVKANAVSSVDVGPVYTPPFTSQTMSRSLSLGANVSSPKLSSSSKLAPIAAESEKDNDSKTETLAAAPVKKSRWGSIFKK
ncbi:hypothetical protein EDD21DRAFT_412540 [Dissophora ornata]|nr:hypothetical protein BGZ58_006766 [Dissophora ornata]KAI8603972.1 hypothetical protein EDD21DRAFT_412540 [Dissophora ornata]